MIVLQNTSSVPKVGTYFVLSFYVGCVCIVNSSMTKSYFLFFFLVASYVYFRIVMWQKTKKEKRIVMWHYNSLKDHGSWSSQLESLWNFTFNSNYLKYSFRYNFAFGSYLHKRKEKRKKKCDCWQLEKTYRQRDTYTQTRRYFFKIVSTNLDDLFYHNLDNLRNDIINFLFMTTLGDNTLDFFLP